MYTIIQKTNGFIKHQAVWSNGYEKVTKEHVVTDKKERKKKHVLKVASLNLMKKPIIPNLGVTGDLQVVEVPAK